MFSLTPDLDSFATRINWKFPDSVTYKSDFEAKYSDVLSKDCADFRIYIHTEGIPSLALSKIN